MEEQNNTRQKPVFDEKEWYIGSDGHHHRISERGKHREDFSDKFKNENLQARKRRKFWANTLFLAGCVLAVVIMIAVVYLYLFTES